MTDKETERRKASHSPCSGYRSIGLVVHGTCLAHNCNTCRDNQFANGMEINKRCSFTNCSFSCCATQVSHVEALWLNNRLEAKRQKRKRKKKKKKKSNGKNKESTHLLGRLWTFLRRRCMHAQRNKGTSNKLFNLKKEEKKKEANTRLQRG